MPAVGGNTLRLPPAPAPKGGGGMLSGLSQAAGGVARTVANVGRQAGYQSRGGSDILSSGPAYGSVQAGAYKQSPRYAKAVLDVYLHQSADRQSVILRAAAQRPSLEGNIILNGLRDRLNPGAKYQTDPLGHVLDYLPSEKAAAKASGVALPGVSNLPIMKIAGNFGKDIVDMPAETLSTVGTLGGDVLSGHLGKAASDLANPVIHTIEHPVQSFIDHPLYTYLMGRGALAGASRLAAAPVRALAPESALGRAVSTDRPGVALTGKLTHERAPYSKSPSIKAEQVAVDRQLYRKAPDGSLVPRTPWLRDRQINQGVGQLVGVAERIRRVNQEQAKHARLDAIRPSRIARAGHAAKTALAYNPKQAAIPGADVLSRIADTTIRRPDTYAQDLLKHAEQVSAMRPHLLGDARALKAHDAYVKAILKEAGKNRTPESLAPVFAAAEKFRTDYAPVQESARGFGHFGADMTKEALQRRELQHYAVTHMGAKMDPAAGLLDAAGNPLANSTILAHLKGPEGTGGRLPAFTPDRVRFDQNGRSSFYVPSERRPLPATAKNTLYAYTHGLTDPSHQSLLEQHALMQGIVDSHRAQNMYADTLHSQMPGGGYAKTFAEAKGRLGGTGLQPINLAQIFHPQAELNQALEHGGVSPSTIEEQAVRHSLDLSSRLQPTAGEGKWAGIDPQALKALRAHENLIQPHTLLRTIRGLNNQFRTVALSTSAKHIPGVAQENLIRDIAQGVGFRSWITGRRMLGAMEKANPERASEVRTQLTGGQVAGMTQAGKVYHVSDHWRGTSAFPLLKAYEAAAKAPGLRQVRDVWRAWTKFAIGGTKKALEQQHQIAGLGKAALREHGYAEAARTAGMVGLIHRAFGLHGQMLEDAAKGLFDPAKARQVRAVIDQIYGKWTDLSPSAQTALMFSPFGLWWANSAKFLARMPVDQPLKTAGLAAATEGTQQERQAHGLDMFMPGGLPLYKQGGIALPGGKILAQNYYSPFGVANDSIGTADSLILPWLVPAIEGGIGVNWLGKPLSSPSNPRGQKSANELHKAQYIIDSWLSSFVPLYTKARQIAQGGASAYDTTDNGLNPFPPATKTPGKGPLEGAKKAFQPFREYDASTGSGATSLLNSIGSGLSGTDLKQSLGDGVSGADLKTSLQP